MASCYFYDPRMLAYDFGPNHPFKPARLEQAHGVLSSCYPEFFGIDGGPGSIEDYRAIHSAEFLEFVQFVSLGNRVSDSELAHFGFSSHDTPAYPGVFEAALAFGSGTTAGARELISGSKLAVTMAGGLHHAKRRKAGGFCVLNDVAAGAEILRRAFGRVLYIDIDLHNGDGVADIFDSEFDVATLSIHETGRTLYPGSGFADEFGTAGTTFNLPLEPYTSGEVWQWTFCSGLERIVEWFSPKVVVLQMGCDAHITDPLGHLNCRVQDWLGAVLAVKDLGLPVLAAGGGGYDLRNVVRMWPAAVMTLAGLDVPDYVPEPFCTDWNVSTFLDKDVISEPGRGESSAREMIFGLSERLREFESD